MPMWLPMVLALLLIPLGLLFQFMLWHRRRHGQAGTIDRLVDPRASGARRPQLPARGQLTYGEFIRATFRSPFARLETACFALTIIALGIGLNHVVYLAVGGEQFMRMIEAMPGRRVLKFLPWLLIGAVGFFATSPVFYALHKKRNSLSEPHS